MRPAIIKIVALVLCCVFSVFVARDPGHAEAGLFLWLFIGFATTIVIFNFLPGITTFLCMAKELFSPGSKGIAPGQKINGHYQGT